ncbi:hypothetical protein E2C01_076364 [Portunus trituberculatus]|uniref:Uncharacterized protein n=1 Tax=Portunus trituberculatus TaxID=210409 RepID=A0A5B7IHH6_PORTR|nr:hypothetical protein [Portunus trituberculatus]
MTERSGEMRRAGITQTATPSNGGLNQPRHRPSPRRPYGAEGGEGDAKRYCMQVNSTLTGSMSITPH